jgi:hypothetical protein
MLARIKTRGDDWVFAPTNFVDLGTRPAVDKALSRMAAAGVIHRVSRGLYDVPRQHPIVGTTAPSVDKTARALDRLLHHAETVIVEGRSYRMKDQIEEP